MNIKRFDVEVNYVRLCPYCRERKIKKATCGHPICQYIHHKKATKKYWHEVYKKL